MRGLNGLQGLAPRKASAGLRRVVPSIELASAVDGATTPENTLTDVPIGAPHPNRVVAIALGRSVNAVIDTEAWCWINGSLMASLQNPAGTEVRQAFTPLFYLPWPEGALAELRFSSKQISLLTPKVRVYRIIANDPWPVDMYRATSVANPTVFSAVSLKGDVGLYGAGVGANYSIASRSGLISDENYSSSTGSFDLGRIISPRDGFNLTFGGGSDRKGCAALTWR